MHGRLQNRMETCMTSPNLIWNWQCSERTSRVKACLWLRRICSKGWLTICNLFANAFSIFNSWVWQISKNALFERLRKLVFFKATACYWLLYWGGGVSVRPYFVLYTDKKECHWPQFENMRMSHINRIGREFGRHTCSLYCCVDEKTDSIHMITC